MLCFILVPIKKVVRHTLCPSVLYEGKDLLFFQELSVIYISANSLHLMSTYRILKTIYRKIICIFFINRNEMLFTMSLCSELMSD